MKKQPSTTIEELQKKVIAFRDARNWKQFHTPKDLGMGLVLEANEFMEHFLWKNEDEIKKYIKTHKEDLADELSDTLYCILVIAYDLKIDLPKAFLKKLIKNGEKYPIEKAKNSHKKYNEL
jgi:NTP pyrophosphatase (non-canonical NTP hydrolase)